VKSACNKANNWLVMLFSLNVLVKNCGTPKMWNNQKIPLWTLT
jgi:hypothetical protein